MNQWRKGIAQFHIGKTLYLSIPFTWLLAEANAIAENHKGPVYVGGPAVDLMPDYLSHVAHVGGECPVRPLDFHNPLATFTTRGCVNKCPFCAVPKIEGEFRELEEWPVRPVICDNNLLAASQTHFDRVIDRLKAMPYVDFNQGLDARLLTAFHANRLAELKCKVRLALDHANLVGKVHDSVQLLQRRGIKDIGIYVLIGFKDTMDDALFRLETVRSWGLMPNPMRYQPLDSMKKNSYVAPGWTDFDLRRVTRYYSRLTRLGHIPFEDYKDDLPLFRGQLKSAV